MSNIFFKEGKPFYACESEVECHEGKKCINQITADITEIIVECKKHLGKSVKWSQEEYELARLISHNWTKMTKTAKELGIDTTKRRRIE